MQVDGEEAAGLLFRTVPYTIETDEAEMIAINFVSTGAGSAAAVADAQPAPTSTAPPVEDKKGKKRASPEATETKAPTATLQDMLTSEEQDQIANLTTRLNSVKMLRTRLTLLNDFVRSLPPSYLSDANISITADSPSPATLPHLRNLQSLLTTLFLLTPPEPTTNGTTTSLQSARNEQRNDVNLTQLLNSLTKDVQALQEVGRTFNTVDGIRGQSKRKNNAPGNLGGIGGGGGGATTFDMDPGFGAMQRGQHGTGTWAGNDMMGFHGASGRNILN